MRIVKLFESRLRALASIAIWFTPALSLAHAAEETASETTARGAIEQDSVFVTGASKMLVATVLLLIAVWLVWGIRLWTLARLERLRSLPGGIPVSLVTDLRSYLLQAASILARLISTVVSLVLLYVWLVYSLNQFTYTASWGERSADFLIDLLASLGTGALSAIPGIVTVVIIILIARWCARLINMIFKEVQAGKLSFDWLERETSRTTQTLLIAVVWLFALVVAYPYIPGSETEAFKGLSVLIGLMITR
jgi:hypothetical protein